MNFINRAIKNTTRMLTKTILLVLTFFVIGNFVIIGLSVANASDTAKTLTRQKMRAVVTYELDYNEIWKYADSIEDEDERTEFYSNYPRITLEDINEIIKDERVKTANAAEINMVYPVEGGIDFVHLNNNVEENLNNSGTSCWFDDMIGEQYCETYIEPTFTIKSNYFPSMIELEDGDWNILEGRFYSKEDIDNANMVVLVSKALAEANGLGLGDHVKVAVQQVTSGYYTQMGINEEDVTADLEIIGIYEHNHPITPDNDQYDYTFPYENYDNMLLVPGTSFQLTNLKLNQIAFDYYAEMYPDEEYYKDPANRPTGALSEINISEATLLLNDPLEVDNFVEEYSNNLPQFKKISADNEEFNKLAKPLDTLSDYATFIVWLVVINAIVIITLVTALTLKTREYEIGVLLSIGASKFKVIAQFFIELAIVAVVGFTFAIGTGTIVSKQIGSVLLENQIQSAGLNEDEEEYWYGHYESIWDTDYTTDISLDDLVAEYNVTVSPVIIAEIYVMGLGIVLVSVLIPSFMIMRYNPKKILMNQG